MRADPVCDLFFVSGAFDKRCVFFADDRFFDASEHLNSNIFQFDAELFADQLATGQDGDILEDGFTAVAKAGSFDGADFEAGAEAVDDKCCQRFPFDIFCDDEERSSRLSHSLEDREELFDGSDLLLVEENEDIFQNALLRLRVGHEVGGDVAPVEIHPFDDIEGRFKPFALFHGDRAVFADFFHRFCNDFADLRISVGGDGGDLGDLFAVLDRFT